MAAVRSSTQTITPDRLVYDLRTAGAPAISPDGSTIVFSLSQADRDSGKTRSQLWRLAPDGSGIRQITEGGITNTGPVWSPDGAHIAWVSKRDGDHSHAI